MIHGRELLLPFSMTLVVVPRRTHGARVGEPPEFVPPLIKLAHNKCILFTSPYYL